MNKRKNTTPKVSVLLPLYNTNPHHLREAVEGILNQTFIDFELIILNDSPKNTALDKIISEYKDPRIIYRKNERNMGIVNSRNKLIDMARGKYIAIHDHDDISVQDRFEVQVKYLDKHPDIGVISGLKHYFGNTIRIIHSPEFDKDIRAEMCRKTCVSHGSAMIRKSLLDLHNIRYEHAYNPSEDYMLWVRLMQYTKFYNIQKPTIFYRYLNHNTSVLSRHEINRTSDLIASEFRLRFPDSYQRFRKNNPIYFKLKLFNFIPCGVIYTSGLHKLKYKLFGIFICKVVKMHNKSKIKIFNKITLISIKSGEKHE